MLNNRSDSQREMLAVVESCMKCFICMLIHVKTTVDN